jgi:hypothetical protein
MTKLLPWRKKKTKRRVRKRVPIALTVNELVEVLKKLPDTVVLVDVKSYPYVSGATYKAAADHVLLKVEE